MANEHPENCTCGLHAEKLLEVIAVDPEYRELHAIYVRCAEINERLFSLGMPEAALQSKWAAPLFAAYAELGHSAGRMIMRLQQIKTESPELFEAWRKAGALPPGPAGDPPRRT